jgi:hypothetical protein
MEDLRRELGSRGPQGVAQGNGAAVGVDVALPVALLKADGPARGNVLGGEGLVDFKRSMSSGLRPASFRAFGIATAGPMPISSGAQPATAKTVILARA